MLLLTKKWTPPSGFTFPARNGRRYNCRWEEEYPWLRYSRSKDAAFCAYCILFGNTTFGKGTASMEVFQSSGFSDWKNAMGSKRGMLLCHHNSEAHKEAAIRALSYKSVIEGAAPDISSCLSEAHKKQVKQNREILISIIDLVIVLGKRNISFRGHTWNKETKREDGNFDFFLHWKSKFDPVLKHHLEHCQKNASYTSPIIQNELITLAGNEVRSSILDAARSAKWFSVMADESTDVSTKEQMAICIRYVESDGFEFQVREEFVGFVELESTDAESISVAIIDYLKVCQLDIANLRGQGYDGAAVMSGKVSGVCTRIQSIQPRALYHHCRAHTLNLVLSSSCHKVPDIRNLFCSIGKMTWFLGASAKRKNILRRYLLSDDISDLVATEESEEVCDVLVQNSANRSVPKLCETRWSARVVTVSSVISKYKSIHLALKDIFQESSDTDARINAQSYTKLMESSLFIVSLIVAQHILSISHPLSMALQKTNCDIVKAYQDANFCKDAMMKQRVESKFESVWEKATTIADSIGVALSKPRTATCSRYRSNAGCDLDADVKEYYRRNVYFPFIDHCVSQFNERFPDTAQSLFLGYKLLPSKLSSFKEEDIETIEQYYGPDLLDKAAFRGEVEKWKIKIGQTDNPSTPMPKHALVKALKVADAEFFPNIHEIFKLILTLPVGSVPCERSFSSLRRLKDWSRANMTEERLCGLALLYTHRDMDVSRENVLKRFDASGHRRIGSL